MRAAGRDTEVQKAYKARARAGDSSTHATYLYLRLLRGRSAVSKLRKFTRDNPQFAHGWVAYAHARRRIGELDKARPIVAVCRAGGRSAQATVILKRAEFADIANLAGGMLRWRAQHCVVDGGRD